jgi:hypothetical protein
MEEDVALQRSHEEQRGRLRIAHAQPARRRGAAEVAGHDGEAAARRAVRLIEGQYQRSAPRVSVHGHDDATGDDALGEGDELRGNAAEDDARVGLAGRARQIADRRRNLDGLAAAHRFGEERVFGVDVAQERGGGDAELAGDIGEGGGGEPLGAEDATGGVEDLVAADARRAAHL